MGPVPGWQPFCYFHSRLSAELEREHLETSIVPWHCCDTQVHGQGTCLLAQRVDQSGYRQTHMKSHMWCGLWIIMGVQWIKKLRIGLPHRYVEKCWFNASCFEPSLSFCNAKMRIKYPNAPRLGEDKQCNAWENADDATCSRGRGLHF